MPQDGPARVALERSGAIVITRSIDEAVALSERMAPEHVVCDTPAVARRLRRAGTVFVGHYSAQAAGDYITGSNHVLPTSGAAAGRGGLSAADFVRDIHRSARHARRAAPRRAARDRARRSRRAARARGVNPHPGNENMRLHLNENTAGCSPAVLETLRALGREDAGCYPDYGEARAAVAECFGVPADHVLLTNGLDEGILAAVGAAFRHRTVDAPETLGVAPAFDMYEMCTTALGGRMVAVPLGDRFELDTAAIKAAVTRDTRIVFVTNPHNPSGVTCRT